MRSWIAGVVIVVLQAAAPAAGQITDTDASRIASSGSDFRFSGEPVVLGGTSYYPSGPTVFFDGAVMVRSSSFKGVPIYVDGTRDPYNIVYVPVGGKLMRPYERRRTDQVADTLAPPPATAPDEVEEAAGESVVAQTPPGDRPPPPDVRQCGVSGAARGQPGDLDRVRQQGLDTGRQAALRGELHTGRDLSRVSRVQEPDSPWGNLRVVGSRRLHRQVHPRSVPMREAEGDGLLAENHGV